MNILFLPTNIASLSSITASALNRIDGIKAICITQLEHKYQTGSAETIYMPVNVSKRNPVKWIANKLLYKKRIKKYIQWADVIHYMSDTAFPTAEDLKWAHDMNKVIFIEWVGSDIRDPEILTRINPYFHHIFNNGYEYASFESRDRSQNTQALFLKYGAIPLVVPEMSLFVDKLMFPRYYLISQRLDVNRFKPSYPRPDKRKPLIIHSPTAKIAKGSNYIESAINQLKREFDFDFVLLHDMERSEVLSLMQQCDIFIDQIVCGGFGMAAVEAMSMGKPVVGYLMPELFDAGLSRSCPIVSANPDTIVMQLRQLLSNGELRYSIGKQGRLYTEEFHDANKTADYFLSIYNKEYHNKNKGALA